ncbi:MAG: GyrI-like domain-containing protein [Xanthomonadales bacterium]|nr:GyrI-like domain-containing protein [Xanthomonadales bacterium]
MFKKFLYFIVIIVLIFSAVGLFLPRDIRIERSIQINRPASMIFVLLNGYSNFNTWSPWVERDPSASYSVSGPTYGVGARLAWSGDPRLTGSGRQEIIESTAPSLVRIRFQFENQGEAIMYYNLSEDDDSTLVKWGFDTDVTKGQGLFGGIMARYFGLFFDRWLGSDYEQGLANLKRLAESFPSAEFSDLEVEIIEVEPQNILYIENVSSQAPGDIAAALADAYLELTAFISNHNLQMSAQPMAISRAWNESGYSFDAAIPVSSVDVLPEGNVQIGTSPSGRVLRVIHRGGYDQMMPTYEKISAYMGAHGLEGMGVSWEQYISDPGNTPTDDLITHIYFLLKN